MSPETVPLFADLCPAIVEELGGAGLASFPREAPLEREVWDFLKSRSRAPPVGRRIALNRFGGAYIAAKRFLPLWSVMLLERTMLALEQGMLQGKHLRERLCQQVERAESSALPDTSTDGRRLQLEDRKLRACCANAVAISVLALQDPLHRRAISLIVAAGAPLDRWHTVQNCKLRSIADTEEWLVQQIAADYMKTVCEFPALLEDASVLSPCGFLVGSRQELNLDNRLEDQAEADTCVEDEFSATLGQLAMELAKQRKARGIWKYSWPCELLAALHSEEDADRVFKGFGADEKAFVAFEARGRVRRRSGVYSPDTLSIWG